MSATNSYTTSERLRALGKELMVSTVYGQWAQLCEQAAIELEHHEPERDEGYPFKAIGFINNSGGVTWEPNQGPGDQEPGKLVYVTRSYSATNSLTKGKA